MNHNCWNATSTFARRWLNDDKREVVFASFITSTIFASFHECVNEGGGGLWNKENVRSSASEQKETKQDALREPRPVSCLQTMCCWGDTAAPLSLFSGAAAHYHVQASGNESRQKRFHNRSVDGEPTMHGFRSATRASHVIAYCGRKCTSALLWSHKCRQAARRRIACPFFLKLTPKEGAYGGAPKRSLG